MKVRFHIVAVAGALTLATMGGAAAGLPESYVRIWRDPAALQRIDGNIEQYRKGEAVIEVVDAAGRPVPDAPLVIAQQRHEFLFGCNLFALEQLATPELNRKYEAAFTNLFNCATVPFYWKELEPREGQPRFAADSPRIWRRPPPDRLVAWCRANGITPKGHALMYVKNMFMPDWTRRDDAEAFRRQGAAHLAGIAARYGRDIQLWDAVNEELPRLDNLAEWHAVPADFLPWCFEEAGRLFPPEARLMINDGTDQAHVTTSRYAGIVKGLQERGVRVGGIGMQFHVYHRAAMLAGTQYPRGQLEGAYAKLGLLGLPLYITEITIPGTGGDGPELQAAIVADLYRLWFSTKPMAGVTWWNLGDGTAFEDENKMLGGLLDQGMEPKPAYAALDRLINHEWKTSATLRTDAGGKAHFRGFHGSYAIQVAAGGVVQTLPFVLKSGLDTNRATLTVPIGPSSREAPQP